MQIFFSEWEQTGSRVDKFWLSPSSFFSYFLTYGTISCVLKKSILDVKLLLL